MISLGAVGYSRSLTTAHHGFERMDFVHIERVALSFSYRPLTSKQILFH